MSSGSSQRLPGMEPLRPGTDGRRYGAHVAAGELPGHVTLVARGEDVHIDAIGTPSFAGERPPGSRCLLPPPLSKPIVAKAAVYVPSA